MVSKLDERWDKLSDNPLVMVSELKKIMEAREKWVQEVDDFMDDEDVVSVLNTAARMIAGEIPEPAKVALVLVKLEACALKFRTQYTAFMSYKKGTTDANMFKNHYKELYTGIDRLVNSLKYVAR